MAGITTNDRTGSTTEGSWRGLYVIGAVAAFVALAGMMLDVVITMLPGWGAASVPATAVAWLEQFASDPLLGMRNLDFLNITVSVIALPMYLALVGAHRRTAPALASLGLLLVAIGTALFVAGNAALPMLELARNYSLAGTEAQRLALTSAAEALLVRGAHGSFGAFPGFILSEVGTLVVAIAMLRGRLFGRPTAWIGIVGVTILAIYTTAYTFGSGEGALVMAVAIPGGLLMIAWHVMVGVRLLRLRHGDGSIAQAARARVG